MMNQIWKKDDFFLVSDKRYDMDPEVVELPMSAPLSWQFSFEVKPLGEVTNIRLEDGEILGDLEFFDEKTEESIESLEDNVRLGGYYTNVLKNEKGDRITSCTLRGVSLVMESSMPNFKGQGS